jgi:hypothetical protein
VDTQPLTPREVDYPTYFDSSRFGLTDVSVDDDYPTYFDREPFSMSLDTANSKSVENQTLDLVQFATCAQELLGSAAPYAGDEMLADKEEMDYLSRFYVYRVSDTQHLVIDHAYTYMGDEFSEFLLPSAWLETPEFNVVQWYTIAMGDVYSTAILGILNSCLCYPGDDFDTGSSQEIFEKRFRALPVKNLRRPKFNFYHWVCKQYGKSHREDSLPMYWLDEEPMFGTLFNEPCLAR